MPSALAVLLVAACLAVRSLCASAEVQAAGEEPPVAGGLGPPPAILERDPRALPRAESGRWSGFFDPEGFAERVAGLPEGARAGLERADAAYRAGNLPRALEELFAVLEAEPDLPPALLVLGTTYFRLQRYGDAIVALERFLAVAPSQVWRTQALAHARYSLGDYEGARASYEAVLADGRESREALRGLALCHWRLGDGPRALEILFDLVAREPDNEAAHAWLARVLYDEARSEEALPVARRAVELAPYDPAPLYTLSQIEFDLGHEEEALAHQEAWRELDRLVQERRFLEAQLRLRPESFGLQGRLVEVLRSLGDVPAAREALARLLRSRPPEVAALDLHLFVLDVAVELGDDEGALAAALALEQACPEEPDAWRRLELFYARRRDRVNQVRAGELYRRLRRD